MTIVSTATQTAVVQSRAAAAVVQSQQQRPVVVSSSPKSVVMQRPAVAQIVSHRSPVTAILASGTQGPPGVQGEPGPPGAGADGNIEVPFSFGDATPLLLGNVDGVLVSASVVILTPFDGDAPELRVGSLDAPELAVPAAANNPAETGRYEATPSVRVTATDLFLFISPGIGTTQGAGLVYVEIAP